MLFIEIYLVIGFLITLFIASYLVVGKDNEICAIRRQFYRQLKKCRDAHGLVAVVFGVILLVLIEIVCSPAQLIYKLIF